MNTGDHVAVTVEDGIAEVRLNRPDKLNALDFGMFDGLIATGEGLAANPAIRAVILSGAGEGFCAGLDVGAFTTPPEDLPPIEARTHGISNLVQRAVMVWRDVPVPVIAALHGVAIGAGVNIALAADMRFAHPATRLAIAEIKWGLIPAMAGAVFLPRLVRDDVWRDLVYTGRIVDGMEAAALGLVTRTTDDPRAAAHDSARAIALRNPDAIRAAKALFRHSPGVDEAAVLALESALQTQVIGRPNQKEAVRAARAGEKPRFVPTR